MLQIGFSDLLHKSHKQLTTISMQDYVIHMRGNLTSSLGEVILNYDNNQFSSNMKTKEEYAL